MLLTTFHSFSVKTNSTRIHRHTRTGTHTHAHARTRTHIHAHTRARTHRHTHAPIHTHTPMFADKISNYVRKQRQFLGALLHMLWILVSTQSKLKNNRNWRRKILLQKLNSFPQASLIKFILIERAPLGAGKLWLLLTLQRVISLFRSAAEGPWSALKVGFGNTWFRPRASRGSPRPLWGSVRLAATRCVGLGRGCSV